MNIDERIAIFEILFEALQSTNSRLEKESEVKVFLAAYPELIEDWTYILETLDGKHPIGWTFKPIVATTTKPPRVFNTVKEMIQYCEDTVDKTVISTTNKELGIGYNGIFLAPIVNRTLRLGIGKSLLAKSDITPMLAKKYEGGALRGDYVVTEKLDGNRCVAVFNKGTNHWEFYSRSGKPMKVDFDMIGLDPDFIYDGEVMSEEQTDLSDMRHKSIADDIDFEYDVRSAQLQFNKTSGLINSHIPNKRGLIYNVFDIIDTAPYYERRECLNNLNAKGDVRILPVLYAGKDMNIVKSLLGRITQMGGEGVMLNNIDRSYEHKRSDALLKYKQVQFMDMEVTDVYDGTGKYAGLVGGLTCILNTDDGKIITCDVGSGLSDAQRMKWAIDQSLIIGKIVQIGYHELTQREENIGTNTYSLRFPRLIKVRTDKTNTSEY